MERICTNSSHLLLIYNSIETFLNNIAIKRIFKPDFKAKYDKLFHQHLFWKLFQTSSESCPHSSQLSRQLQQTQQAWSGTSPRQEITISFRGTILSHREPRVSCSGSSVQRNRKWNQQWSGGAGNRVAATVCSTRGYSSRVHQLSCQQTQETGQGGDYPSVESEVSTAPAHPITNTLHTFIIVMSTSGPEVRGQEEEATIAIIISRGALNTSRDNRITNTRYLKSENVDAEKRCHLHQSGMISSEQLVRKYFKSG